MAERSSSVFTPSTTVYTLVGATNSLQEQQARESSELRWMFAAGAWTGYKAGACQGCRRRVAEPFELLKAVPHSWKEHSRGCATADSQVGVLVVEAEPPGVDLHAGDDCSGTGGEGQQNVSRAGRAEP